MAGELIVDARTSDQFETIAAALNHARAGDVIIVMPGVYREQLRITRAITLKGADLGTSIIQGTITVERVSQFVMSNLSIRGDTESLAFSNEPELGRLVSVSCALCTVENCIVSNANTGIYSTASHLVLKKVKFQRCNFGVNCEGKDLSSTDRDDVSIDHCEVLDFRRAGIRAQKGTQVLVSNCTLSNDGSYGFEWNQQHRMASGIEADQNAQIIVNTCELRGPMETGIVAPKKVHDCTIINGSYSFDGKGIALIYPDTTIANCTISNMERGIDVYWHGTGTIQGCQISGVGLYDSHEEGISIFGEDTSATIEQCQISKCETGISVSSDSSAVIRDNHINANRGFGIHESQRGTFKSGLFKSGLVPVRKRGAKAVTGNDLAGNAQGGLSMLPGGNTSISGNHE